MIKIPVGNLLKNWKNLFSELDTTLNIKVNSSLKAEFEKLCKKITLI